jgi:hypothetical protein
VGNDFLVSYLNSVDEALLSYLDETEQLSIDTVNRLRRYVSALLDGSITPTAARRGLAQG